MLLISTFFLQNKWRPKKKSNQWPRFIIKLNSKHKSLLSFLYVLWISLSLYCMLKHENPKYSKSALTALWQFPKFSIQRLLSPEEFRFFFFGDFRFDGTYQNDKEEEEISREESWSERLARCCYRRRRLCFSSYRRLISALGLVGWILSPYFWYAFYVNLVSLCVCVCVSLGCAIGVV